MALAGKVATVLRQTTAAGVAVVGAATTNTLAYGDPVYKRYQITNAADRYLDRAQPVTVHVNGAVQNGGYTVEHLSGFVVFTNPLIDTDVVTVDATALTLAEAGGMFGWKLDLDADMTETTTFASGGWKEYAATLETGGGSCDAYWWNDTTDVQYVTAGSEVILVLYVDNGANKERWETFAEFKKESIASAVKDIVKESIDFQSTGKVYYRKG